MKFYWLALVAILLFNVDVFAQADSAKALNKVDVFQLDSSYICSKAKNKRVIKMDVGNGCSLFIDKDFVIKRCRKEMRDCSNVLKENKNIITSSLNHLVAYLNLRDTIPYDSLANYAQKDSCLSYVCDVGYFILFHGSGMLVESLVKKKFTCVIDAQGVTYKKLRQFTNQKAVKQEKTNWGYIEYTLPNKEQTSIYKHEWIIERLKFL